MNRLKKMVGLVLWASLGIAFAQAPSKPLPPYFEARWGEAIRKGDPVAMVRVNMERRTGTSRQYGNAGCGAIFIPSDYIERLIQWAEAGNSTAMRYLSAHYLDGTGVEQSSAKADEWSEKAVAAGEYYEMYTRMRYQTVGAGEVEPTPDTEIWRSRAYDACKKRADAGDNEAMYDMVHLSLVPKSFARKQEKRNWLRMAAERGHMVAAYSLGDELTNEKDPKFREEGWSWLLKAAEAGEWRAMLLVGQYYHDGAIGQRTYNTPIDKDLVKAWYWFDKAVAAIGCPYPLDEMIENEYSETGLERLRVQGKALKQAQPKKPKAKGHGVENK